jgi:hypothetical protein
MEKMHCMFCLQTHSCIVILSVYIDNLLLIGCIDDINFLKQQLHKHFKLKDLSPLKKILGITVHHDLENSTLDLSQLEKIAELTEEFGLSNCKPLLMPLPTSCNLEVIETISEVSCSLPYCCIVGALLWIALASHPDTLFTVVYLTHFLCAYN